MLIRQVPPTYPPLAKQARVSGEVRLRLVVGTDGAVKEVTVVSGHPLLIQAAIDAVRQWLYRPTVVNGVPVEVLTEVAVNFTLTGS
jgi:protein TonB